MRTRLAWRTLNRCLPRTTFRVAAILLTASLFTAILATHVSVASGSQYATIDGLYAGGGAVTVGNSVDLLVVGRGGVPSAGVGAVALNVTVTDPTSASYVTVWPTGSA